MTNKTPVLVTLTSPSCSGKSHLLNFIRSEGYPCLVSTTTRAPRAGEQDGVDYYFISDEESRAIEEHDGFAELLEYGGFRYGVTNEEFHDKLAMGLSFLIVEPLGIDKYAKPALEVGAKHLKFFVFAPEAVRCKRLRGRLEADLREAFVVDSMTLIPKTNPQKKVETIVAAHFDRLTTMLTKERDWLGAAKWDEVLDGTASPKKNLEIILNAIDRKRLEVN